MPIKNLVAGCASLAIVLVIFATGGVARAGTGCGEPQRLCASAAANTSADAGSIPSAARSAPLLLAALDPELGRQVGKPPPSTHAIPDNAGAGTRPATPIRIALLLPTRSSTLTGAAEAVRAGFMAGFERDGAGFTVELVSTGDSPQDALDAYARAAAGSDIVVGPLARPAVTALAASNAIVKPTLALNSPEPRTPLPRGMLVAGLSVEDEARQIADWAAREHPHARALVLTGDTAWAQRAAGAFDARWSELGHTDRRVSLASTNGRIDQAGIDGVRNRIDIDPPDLLFAALDAGELRQVRAVTGTSIPCYAGSAANPGRAAAPDLGELDGVRLLDLPWMVRPDQSAVMVYPRPLNTEQPLDMERLYALGIDAFLLARQLSLHPDAPVDIDGVTGRLLLDRGAAQLERREAATVYRQGVFDAVDPGR